MRRTTMSNSIPTIEDLAFNLELYAKGHPINPHILTESASLLRKVASGEYEKPEEDIKFDFEAHKVASREYTPVVHAHWIKTDEDYSSIWKCSHCGLIWELSNDDTPQENEMFRCPKCGAIMDEDEESNGQAN
jgi:rubrerythrin